MGAADDDLPSAGWCDYLADHGWRQSPWQRSAKGNLWTMHRGHRVVVYHRDGDGQCQWLVTDGVGVVHSPRTFATENEAIADVMDTIAECERG